MIGSVMTAAISCFCPFIVFLTSSRSFQGRTMISSAALESWPALPKVFHGLTLGPMILAFKFDDFVPARAGPHHPEDDHVGLCTRPLITDRVGTGNDLSQFLR